MVVKLIRVYKSWYFDEKVAEFAPFSDQNINLINFYKPSSTF